MLKSLISARRIIYREMHNIIELFFLVKNLKLSSQHAENIKQIMCNKKRMDDYE